MYDNPSAAAGMTTLPVTGMAIGGVWMMLAAFALLALGMAILRIVPRLQS